MFPSVTRREIIVLLCVKAALLGLLYVLFFSPSHQFSPTPAQMRVHLLQSPS